MYCDLLMANVIPVFFCWVAFVTLLDFELNVIVIGNFSITYNMVSTKWNFYTCLAKSLYSCQAKHNKLKTLNSEMLVFVRCNISKFIPVLWIFPILKIVSSA